MKRIPLRLLAMSTGLKSLSGIALQDQNTGRTFNMSALKLFVYSHAEAALD